MSVLHIDFETRSACDLRETGAEVYSRHPTTEIICMAWALGDAEPAIWNHGEYDPVFERDVMLHIAEGGLVYAHNAAFELTIWGNVLCRDYPEMPPLRAEQIRCTMAMAYAMGLPGSLDDCARALGLAEGKDQKGYRLMLQMAKPRRVEPSPHPDGANTYVWWDDADKLERLYAYCKQDVEVERNIHKKLMELSTAEQNLWALDHRINQRGIQIDTQSVTAAVKVVEQEKKRLDGEMRRATGGAVKACSEVKKLTDWVAGQGIGIDGMGKADVVDLLGQAGLPDAVSAALRLRQEAGKSSTAKLTKMLSCSCSDGRVRGSMQYHGAQTGRWAGRQIQIQNYTRPPKWLEDPELQDEIIRGLGAMSPEYIDLFYGAPMEVLSGVMRGFLIAAPGNDLISCDYANIEGRVLAWLAGEAWKLEAFRQFDRGEGPDLYLIAAGRIYNCQPSEAKAHRQIGKVSELALGYQGHIGAFQTMAATYGVRVSDDEAKVIISNWRDAHPVTKRFWYALEEAAIGATLYPGSVREVGVIKYRRIGDFLWCRLPSGRAICYPFPEVRRVQTPWGAEKDGLTYMFVPSEQDKKKGKLLDDARTFGKWVRGPTYGGSLAENVTQAVARDILANALPKLEAAGYPTVFHVHDEIVAEVPRGFGSVEQMIEIMVDLPAWAEGIPVSAEGWRGRRYRK